MMIAPQIRYVACGRFRSDSAEVAVCVSCGWLDEEHDRAETVIPLRVRRPASFPERALAS